MADAIILKHCAGCNKEKPTSDFGKNRCKPDGITALCLECNRRWRNNHRHEYRKFHPVKKKVYPPQIFNFSHASDGSEIVEIFLKHGVAIVDMADWPVVSQYHWCSFWGGSRKPYASATSGEGRPMLHQIVFRANIQVDHVDGNGLNNRKNNLREATQAQNSRNRQKPRGTFTSRFKGVRLKIANSGNSFWNAHIRVNYKQKHLGTFASELEAAAAYNAAAKKYFGEFALLNTLPESPKEIIC